MSVLPSDFQIFVIGPVGAGKTVFSYMLNEHVKQNPELGITFSAGDFTTKSYLSDIGAQLENQCWPPGTPPGELIQLRWEWKFDGRTAHFNLIDPPGEDIENELRGDSDSLRILESIRQADVLFVLLDLHEHQTESKRKRTQNAWIVENVLKNAGGAHRVVLGVSKGDRLSHLLPAEAWSDKAQVLELVGKMMPEFDLAGYRGQLEQPIYEVVMFSAIAVTDSKVDASGKLTWVPAQPLRSEGVGVFVKAIQEGHESRLWQIFFQKWQRRLTRLRTSPVFWKSLFVLIAFYHLYWFLVSI